VLLLITNLSATLGSSFSSSELNSTPAMEKSLPRFLITSATPNAADIVLLILD
jgi:hypothetical protein